MNAVNGLVGEMPRHQESDMPTVADNLPGYEFEMSNTAPDVGNHISCCLEYAKADKAINLVGPDCPPSLRSSVSF